MPKSFNTTGVCVPEKHYMVDITNRIQEIKKYVAAGKYLTINRARQYGKTTTLTALRKALESEYVVVSLDFQGISNAGFKTEQTFVQELSRLILGKKRSGLTMPELIEGKLSDYVSRTDNKAKLGELFDTFTEWCALSEKEVVVFIDEVDSATNNQVFLDFLGQLREGYILRDTEGIKTFKSVILAGVTYVNHLKGKIRIDDQHKVNSPWNIEADFNVDMSLNADGIAGMLEEYRTDHQLEFDSKFIAKEIFDYTNGYPYLVSRMCQIIDERLFPKKFDSLQDAWSRNGIDEAVKTILYGSSTLFDSLSRKLENYPDLRDILKSILMEGTNIPFNNYQEELSQMKMHGFISNRNGTVVVSNRIFETFLYNLFLSDEIMKNNVFVRESGLAKNMFVEDNKLNMPLILERFIGTYTEVFGPLEEKFKKKDGREQFLLYLKPIINGTGNYYIEAQTRDQTRTDIILDYLGQRYIIELKIWHGDSYNRAGEEQLTGYLDFFGEKVGYMLSFNFNKKKKSQGVRRIVHTDKVLFEAML
ncbi:AAA-like domain-containing protein [Butyrivibrio sp. AC2005]|uniref:AAA-like domain-containing protein n=1 Tax=Butyrivibrio sp. AC2005 TaxID=1280672 RepID=UPI0003FD981E|nr:AAA-like domain-containing protein [Butyrivibrio sp. AC2005]